MSLLTHANVYWEFLGQCTQCGHCTHACTSLESADSTLGDIAKGLLEADRNASSEEDLKVLLSENTQLMQAIRNCFFCTLCKNTCFAHNDVSKLIYSARVELQNLGLIPRGDWSSVQVDEEWDIFTAYRAIHGIGFSDLTRHKAAEDHDAEDDCKIAFFPGCSLAAYAPELTREIFSTLEELGGKTTLIDYCCGSPLRSAGFFDRAEILCNNIAKEIQTSGAELLICVCPGCANEMQAALKRMNVNVTTISLPAFLQQYGFAPKQQLPTASLWLSKSCQDRDGSYLEETCAALGQDSLTPTVFKGCCGAGGGVNAFNPERAAEQTKAKLNAVPDGSTVISMCPTCTYTYAFELMNAPRNLINKHYAELLFESQIDWDTVFAQLGGMWSGEYGAWLAEALA